MSNEHLANANPLHLLAEVEDDETRGSITVSPDVLVEIIELTAHSIEGISGFVSARKVAGRTHSIINGPEPHADNSWHERNGTASIWRMAS